MGDKNDGDERNADNGEQSSDDEQNGDDAREVMEKDLRGGGDGRSRLRPATR